MCSKTELRINPLGFFFLTFLNYKTVLYWVSSVLWRVEALYDFCSALFLTCFLLHHSFSLASVKYESQISNIKHVGTGFTTSPFFPFVCLGTCKFEN